MSVFSVELVDVAELLPWDAYKTASPDLINRPLLEALAATGRPLIVSTGASTAEEIAEAVRWLAPVVRGAGASARVRGSRLRMGGYLPPLSLLQCVSSYPTPPEHAELGGIIALRRAFPGLAIGYSDHTADETTGAEATRLGAVILEKHFTDSRRAAGPDHAASLEPDGFARYAANARAAGGLNGVSGLTGLAGPAELPHCCEKRVLPIEQDVRTVSRQSLTTTRTLPAGHTLTRDDLTIKRPGTGIPPAMLVETIGRRLACGVEADVPLRAEDLVG